MSNPTFNIQIKNPCSENWHKMTPTEKGRFCHACTKVVYDFTNTSKETFKEIYLQHKGNICGRFYIDQLVVDKVPTKNKITFFQKIAALLILKLTLLNAPAIAQNKKDSMPQERPFDQESKQVNQKVLEGRLIQYETNSGISGTTIIVKNNKGKTIRNTVTQSNGYYKLVFESVPNTPVTFEIKKTKDDRGYYTRVTENTKVETNISELEYLEITQKVIHKKRLRIFPRRQVMGFVSTGYFW